MNKEYDEKLAALEREGKFDVDVNAGEYLFVKEQEPDHRYVYDRFFDKIYYAFLRALVFVFAPFLLVFTYRLRVRGRKNLRAAKKTGKILVANHVALLDCLIEKQAVFNRVYFIAGAHNNKKGFFGYTLKILGLMPYSFQLSNQKNLTRAIAYYLKKGKTIEFNPEQAMWRGYKKLRPFKNGAFYYAVKNNVPVVPMVNLIRDPNGWDKLRGRKFKITAKFLPPVYADESLPERDRINDLKERTRRAMLEEMNAFYKTDSDALTGKEEIL